MQFVDYRSQGGETEPSPAIVEISNETPNIQTIFSRLINSVDCDLVLSADEAKDVLVSNLVKPGFEPPEEVDWIKFDKILINSGTADTRRDSKLILNLAASRGVQKPIKIPLDEDTFRKYFLEKIDRQDLI